MVELATVKGLLGGARLAAWAKRQIEQWEDANTKNLREAVEIARKDYQLQFNAGVEARLNALQGTADQEQALASLLDEEFLLLQLVYQDDAFREPRAKRRVMIAEAAAGSFTAGLSIGELARVQRAIRELDPEDVLRLALIADMVDPPPPAGAEERSDEMKAWHEKVAALANARLHAVAESDSFAVLLAAGCAYISAFTGSFGGSHPRALEVTPLGRRLVQVLQGYIVAQRGASPEKGVPDAG